MPGIWCFFETETRASAVDCEDLVVSSAWDYYSFRLGVVSRYVLDQFSTFQGLPGIGDSHGTAPSHSIAPHFGLHLRPFGQR